jgi:enoyl-CoA hydratase/carnithine racemase
MAQESFDNVRYEVRGGAAWITIDRPDKLNALNRKTVAEIAAAWRLAAGDDAVGAIVLTGAGEKAFVAGADISEMATLGTSGALEFSRFLQESLDLLENSPKPVVAAVNGFALGGGCELAMACHVRIASDGARFGQPEVNLGLIPGAGGTQRLQRIVGRGRALDLILSGEIIDAAEAFRIGLVNRVVPAAELKTAVETYLAVLRKKSPAASGRAIEALVVGGEISQAEAMRFEAAQFALCFSTDDMREGTAAFLEKRKPSFSGN